MTGFRRSALPTALVLFAVTAVTACSGAEGGNAFGDQGVDVCGLTGTEFVEQTFDTTVEEPKRTELSLAGGYGDYHSAGESCYYREKSGQNPLALVTALNHCKKTDPETCLDVSFVNWDDKDRPILDYKRLKGLGDGAGYLEDGGLAVVVAKSTSTWTLVVRSGFTMTEEQHRVVAEQMVGNFGD